MSTIKLYVVSSISVEVTTLVTQRTTINPHDLSPRLSLRLREREMIVSDLILAIGLLPASFAILLTAIILSVWYTQDRRRKNYPPGPFAWPVLGNLVAVGRRSRDMYLYIDSLGERYGDVISLYFGKQLVVFLNSYDVIKEAIVHQSDRFSDRPRTMRVWQELYKRKDLGADHLNSSRNVLKIAFSHSALNQDRIESILMNDLRDMIVQMKSLDRQPFDPTQFCKRLFSCSFYRMLFGNRYDFTGLMFNELNELLYEYMNNLRVELSENFLPVLKMIKPTSSVSAMKKTIEKIDAILDDILSDHKSNFNPNRIEDAISILLECRQNKQHEGYCSDAMIKHSVNNILLAAVESTQVVMRWLLLYLVRYPDVMRRCQQEIDEVVGREQSVSIHHKSRMLYTQATVLETLRHANIAPLGAPRSTTEDTTLKGYFIPKETIVFLNIYAVHMNSELWSSPKQFNPDRWIQNGEIIKSAHFIPFSLGPRFCPGSQLAKMQLFIAASNLLQQFNFSAAGEDLPSLEGIQNMSLAPKPYQIIATHRCGESDEKHSRNASIPASDVCIHQPSESRRSPNPTEDSRVNRTEPLAVVKTHQYSALVICKQPNIDRNEGVSANLLQSEE
ncbi:cytochrome P450 2J2-like [Tubulanus polymorphus]|uniref:cytochrome P450 2J2-like n=1 Tax=Tubulanus polymorphus TaxID=672921 RepID=UPI003DA2573E